MNAKDLRIVFMGTPEFAVASLKALVDYGCHIVGVITAPDKPAGRGRQLHESDVKKYALSVGLPLLQPENLKDQAFIETLRDLKADLQIVVAFRMLPEVVWNMPPMGTFNLHASLLPQYRGAAPINWAIMNGETETGVTTFFLQHAIDTGDILLQDKEPIHPDDTVGLLYERLMHKGAALVVKTIEHIAQGNIKGQPQNAADHLREAPKIFKEHCLIQWNKPCREVYNTIRGLSPYPVAHTQLEGKQLKVYAAHTTTTPVGNTTPGTWKSDGKTTLLCACADYWLALTEVQLEGKKRMSVADFLRGYTFTTI